jgi:two-component system chemotaxis response regulator CheY
MANCQLLAEMEKLRILVVDDEEEIRNLLQGILRDVGIVRVHLAENGATAWQRLNHSELDYDLVISDWLMPRMDGLELLKKMRKGGSKTPFMMLTVKVTVEAVAAAKMAGVTSYVAKPFTYNEFLEKISALAKRIITDKAPS